MLGAHQCSEARQGPASCHHGAVALLVALATPTLTLHLLVWGTHCVPAAGSVLTDIKASAMSVSQVVHLHALLPGLTSPTVSMSGLWATLAAPLSSPGCWCGMSEG